MNRFLVAIGLVVLLIGLGVAAYGLGITGPQTGTATGVFIGVGRIELCPQTQTRSYSLNPTLTLPHLLILTQRAHNTNPQGRAI